MAINAVQFQQGLSMKGFLDQYDTEAKCYRALYRSRWPKGSASESEAASAEDP